ncbi:MAG: hypothetical protein D6692_02995 [Planctomycetota bacterium]|nr:MAG: hypothetical protein D6692_02995 [Planctomycetota bacterium]
MFGLVLAAVLMLLSVLIVLSFGLVLIAEFADPAPPPESTSSGAGWAVLEGLAWVLGITAPACIAVSLAALSRVFVYNTNMRSMILRWMAFGTVICIISVLYHCYRIFLT